MKIGLLLLVSLLRGSIIAIRKIIVANQSLKKKLYYAIYRYMKKSFFLILFLVTLNISLIPDNKNCFTIIVGKNASADGSVIIAHNEDDQGKLFVNVHKIHSTLNKKNELIKLKNNGYILK